VDAFADWLDAREAESLHAAWTALAPVHHKLGRPEWFTSTHGAIILAQHFLGWPRERLEWLARTGDPTAPPPFTDRRPASWCFLENGIDYREPCTASWHVRELSDGTRGVQLVSVGFTLYDPAEDSSSSAGATVIRIFDRARRIGTSLLSGTQTVSTIGAFDIAPLDLFEHTRGFRNAAWTQHDLAATRGMLAQLAAEVDAHYDVSAAWPAQIVEQNTFEDPRREAVHVTTYRYESGPHAMVLTEQRHDSWAWTHAELEGLPWGHTLTVDLHTRATGTAGHVAFRLPLAEGDAVLARLVAMPGITLD